MSKETDPEATLSQFYLSRGTGIPPRVRSGITLKDLLDENEDDQQFAIAVWNRCWKYGYYDDSDLPNTYCFYFSD